MAKNIPTDRFFTKDHEWIKDHKEYALIGITDYAQHCLGDVVYVEMPKIGSSITKGQALGVVESIKAVSDIYAPVSGVVIEVNQNVINNPQLINSDPYENGWLLKIQASNTNFSNENLCHEEYEEILSKEAK